MEMVDELCLSVGKIIVNFNSLELLVRRLTWYLIDQASSQEGKKVTKEFSVSAVIDVGFSNLKSKKPANVTEIKEILKKCKILTDKRNEVAHTYFCVQNQATDLIEIYAKWPQHYKRGEFFGQDEPIDLDSFRAINQQILETINKAEQMLEKIGAGVTFGNNNEASAS